MTDQAQERVAECIGHVLGAIERIQTYVRDMPRDVFLESTLVQDAVIRNFEIIGEAASKIRSADPAFVRRHPQLRLELAYRMRNALIHGYDSVNLLTVWNTIETDLPKLKQDIIDIRQA